MSQDEVMLNSEEIKAVEPLSSYTCLKASVSTSVNQSVENPVQQETFKISYHFSGRVYG